MTSSSHLQAAAGGGTYCPFDRVAIVNRGEAAMRLIHAVREINLEQDRHIATVALFTEPDSDSMFVRQADDTVCLGPATFVDERDGLLKSAYLDYRRLERALVEARASAAWVGWGFVAEHPEFAELCERLGIVFVGPTAAAMRQLGDKISSKRLADEAGLPVAPWSGGPVRSLAEAHAQADRLGYPLMVKATAGGGGRGIRRVQGPEELEQAFEGARVEARRFLPDATLFLERLLPASRHIEVQVVADEHGNVWAAGVRDCTIQRRNQKVLEESASVALTPEQGAELRQAASRLCRAAGYTNAGTVEFLYDVGSGQMSFMEVNSRLQVEHPVTEETTGLDLVKLQLHVAGGGRLYGEEPVPVGHAIEVRLNAEDAESAFAPAPGTVELLRLPTGPGLRIDTGVSEGDTISSEFDSMIAKIVSWGRDRPEALARLSRALLETQVVVRGGSTNRAFLLELLGRSEVKTGEVDVHWLDRLTEAGKHVSHRHAEVALLQAAVQAYDDELDMEQRQFYATAARMRPKVRAEVGHRVTLQSRGHEYELDVYRLGPRLYRVADQNGRFDVTVDRIGRFERRVTCGGRTHTVLSVLDGQRHLIEVDGVAHRVTRDAGGIVRAPAPAVVVDVLVKPGDEVSAGDRLVVLEAMKMELSVVAPADARVAKVLVSPNVQVEAAAPVVQLEAPEESACAAGVERVDLGALAGGIRPVEEADAPHQVLEALRREMLGFDFVPRDSQALLADYARLAALLPSDDKALLAGEDEVLNVFVDTCSLSRTRPDPDLPEGVGYEAHSHHEDLLAYLRSVDGRGEGQPASFLQDLCRALAHYGVGDLEPTPMLHDALFWMVKAQQRVNVQVPAIQSILDRRLEQQEVLVRNVDDGFRCILDRLILATEQRFPELAGQAREVRYQCFERPLFEEVAAETYAEVARTLDLLEADPGGVERERYMQSLVQCPQPLKNLLTREFVSAGESRRRLMLECMTRRYYRTRDLRCLRVISAGFHPVARAEYDDKDRRVHLLTTFAAYDDLADTAKGLVSLIDEAPEGSEVVVDLYVWRSGPQQEEGATQEEVRDILSMAAFPARACRVVVAISAAGQGLGMAGTQHFTYRSTPGGYEEDEIYRDLHPMMAERLRLSRLTEFGLRRLPSVEDVYLFQGTARRNPKDERLFAMAEVRDVTTVRDESGRVAQLPQLERKLIEALAGIRAFQTRRSPSKRLDMNRVALYVWPPLQLAQEELHDIIHRLAPATTGLGIDEVEALVQIVQPGTEVPRQTLVQMSNPAGTGVVVLFLPALDEPLLPLDEYGQRVVQLRRRGLVYPYEIVRMLTPSTNGLVSDFPAGEFSEHDLDGEGRLSPVTRSYGHNTAGIVVGLVRNFTPRHADGMVRVVLLGDPSRGLGALAEAECRRIMAGLDLAEELGVPVEWFALSAGAKIAMDSGTENMDWIARVLRRIIEFTQHGGEINVVVAGINVGAQPYWNAEATMLMHTRGILVMTPDSAMVLTGKQALDYSGGISAEDNQGIGGYERVMGPNGQAQYWAPDIAGACRVLLRHYEHTYLAPGEVVPRRADTTDSVNRDVRSYPHAGTEFAVVGEIFSESTNPGRKKPFDIRSVLRATIDQDHQPLERWAAFRHAEGATVWDAHIGGWPVCLIGLESRSLPRRGFVPADGPEHWTSGTLFPLSSKKVARAINGASGNRPIVVLANLSGFDGSPESMRKIQLEFGAEIGRAVVNFQGPMVFCVVSRYHGGAFVVFSAALNDQLEVAAVEGSFASVIGGAPAAAVVFAREVDARTESDLRVQAIGARVAAAEGAEKTRLRAEAATVHDAVRSEMLGRVADEFDHVHSVERALAVGSVHRIVPAAELRPYVVGALDRGIERYLARRRPRSHDGE